MLSQKIILAIFAALLSQGNIASALPQGSNYARTERIDGRSTSDIISTREALQSTDISMPVVRSNQAPEERGIQERTGAADIASYVGLGLTAGGMIVGGSRWFFMNTDIGKKIHADAKAKTISAATAAKVIVQKLTGHTEAQVEADIALEGGVVALPEADADAIVSQHSGSTGSFHTAQGGSSTR
jgi:hypothetical protein